MYVVKLISAASLLLISNLETLVSPYVNFENGSVIEHSLRKLNELINTTGTTAKIVGSFSLFIAAIQKMLLIVWNLFGGDFAGLFYSVPFVAFFLLLISLVSFTRFSQSSKSAGCYQKDAKVTDSIGCGDYHRLIASSEVLKNLSMELHDGLGSSLAALKINLGYLEPYVQQEAKPHLSKVMLKMDEVCVDIRNMSHNLSLSKEKYLLVDLLEEFVNDLKMQSDILIKMSLGHEIEIESLHQEMKKNIYYIVKELLINAIKHSDASEINLKIDCEKESLKIIYDDNGIGFKHANCGTGIGINNIKSRLKEYYGNILIESVEDAGASIIIEMGVKK